ncbi:MAG TPA: TIR domain-containing protein [Steroidobacteraceae bacterium]|nr:TIR domain-containing protein [Steroidobacteraceae bacterium]
MAEGDGVDTASGGVASRTVFVSYASHDTEIANVACRELESRGIRCWIAPRDVAPGALYADAIVRAINECKVLLIVLSQSAVASSHVGREIERAASKHKQVIALRIDTAPLSPELEYFLSNSQWIDLLALGMPAALSRLTDAVAQGPKTPSHPSPVGDRVDRAPKSTVAKRVVGAAAALVVLAVGIGLGIHFWGSPHGIAHPATVGVSPGAAGPDNAQISDKSIAVLPFTDMSEKKDQEYFADGMVEELLDVLEKIPQLKVIGRTSSFQFKNKSDDLRTIGKALGVAHVVEGSVRRSGDRIRVTAQLIDTRDGTHLWSESFDRANGDILKLQDQIAAGLARALQITVAADQVMSRRPVRNSEAYDLYLRGRYAFDRLDESGWKEAAAYFQEALKLDPSFAPAAEHLAETYGTMAAYGYAPPKMFEDARRAAQLALRLNPGSVFAHAVLGEVHHFYDWDWRAADQEFQQALALDPRHTEALAGAALLASTLGRSQEAVAYMTTSLSLDPLNALQFELLEILQYEAGHLREAEAAGRRALEIAPDFTEAGDVLVPILIASGRFQEALTEAQKWKSNSGLALVYYKLGRRADSDAAVARMTQEDQNNFAFGVAGVHAFRGETKQALSWLERAYEQKDSQIISIKSDPYLVPLAREPRFKALLAKMNLSD